MYCKTFLNLKTLLTSFELLLIYKKITVEPYDLFSLKKWAKVLKHFERARNGYVQKSRVEYVK